MMGRAGGAKLAVMLCWLLAAPACSRLSLKKKEPLKPFVPPPIVVRTTPPEPLVVGEPPPSPGPYLDPESIPFPTWIPQMEIPERPRPQPARTRPATPPQPAAEPAEPPAPPPVSVPKLTQILSDDDAKRYRAEGDEARGAAERVLEAASRRQLNASQTGMVRQVRDLLRQAQAQRDTDLVSSRNLARRAEILARDLQSTLR